MTCFGSSSLFVSFCLCLILGQNSVFVSGDESLIQTTCHWTVDNYDLCVSTLESDPRSKKADTLGLLEILLDLTKNDAKDTTSYVTQLLKDAKDPKLQNVLSQCVELYSNSTTALQSATSSVQEKILLNAYAYAYAAELDARKCHTLFQVNPGLSYPAELACRDGLIEHLCSAAKDIIYAIND